LILTVPRGSFFWVGGSWWRRRFWMRSAGVSRKACLPIVWPPLGGNSGVRSRSGERPLTCGSDPLVRPCSTIIRQFASVGIRARLQSGLQRVINESSGSASAERSDSSVLHRPDPCRARQIVEVSPEPSAARAPNLLRSCSLISSTHSARSPSRARTRASAIQT